MAPHNSTNGESINYYSVTFLSRKLIENSLRKCESSRQNQNSQRAAPVEVVEVDKQKCFYEGRERAFRISMTHDILHYRSSRLHPLF